ncbi:hypothetical protein MYCTH_2310682 [Thermothelomyces thermophilus ATCC 42464]|uniref:PLD phosphodiesterase domain-containing protein n=1 Tax=Thermothelomyces thermophilus (strain ATCC 42464 / BCRC 31852 / DSM 1799) TaxID=573729 RepID=G2QLV0_THET4|nr:uncharacterized protein MYCTH_2310682 [Thermothelomyces thermophilus ATCC 42464]AEO60930.1 hypothetical protein MYCTH_2310682 [Thermothelomyces thermophilus ATCC 42464]
MTKHQQAIQPQISEQIVRLCTSSESVSSLLARDATLSPGDAWEKLYGHRATRSAAKSKQEVGDGNDKSSWELTEHDRLKRAAECGKWGPTRPSDLFLAIYHDALSTLNEDPRRAMVSPSLMGSYGTVPLTIISVLPDIVRHMSNVIVQAQKEVYLATNYWQNSVASRYITNAIRELDCRAGARGAKIVFKILYDRGSPRQLYKPHYIVCEREATSQNVNLPHPDEIPNIDMEIMNFHTPLMGTFHAKYMLVDRRIALLQSNNIQDNDNLEMMVRLEGPIVDSLYDMVLISWNKRLNPPLPCQSGPAEATGHGGLKVWPAGGAGEPATGAGAGESAVHFVEEGVNLNGTAGHQSKSSPQMSTPERDGIGEAGRTVSTFPTQSVGHEPSALPAHTADDPHYDDDITGEVARAQSFLAPKPRRTHMQAVTELLNHTVNQGLPGDPNAPGCAPENFMTPYIPHQTHIPYPMALVNRAPYGPPTHSSVSTPQNAAWLSALRYARDSVYIISPTLNASPLIPAIIEACERGVDVYCYVCLSYNDAGELLPRQGGHNEKVAAALHASPSLSPAGRRHLHYHWYVAKDRTAPVSQARRQRSSHVKLLIADGRVAIQGNGNQDTQSWFHSEEVNVLIDSPALCASWLDALQRNQNTALFGAVNRKDGVWRDAEGRQADGAIGPDAGGVFGWVKGVKGAVERLRGTGGF